MHVFLVQENTSEGKSEGMMLQEPIEASLLHIN